MALIGMSERNDWWARPFSRLVHPHRKKMQRPETMRELPASLTAMVGSFNELVPGVPWDDSAVDKIMFEIIVNHAGSMHIPSFTAHGDVEIELEVRNGQHADRSSDVKASVYWSLPDCVVWEASRTATADGMLDLLLETRSVLKCLQHGPCPTCAALEQPEFRLRLVPEGGCATCVLSSFLNA
jgi:hypothetical protein